MPIGCSVIFPKVYHKFMNKSTLLLAIVFRLFSNAVGKRSQKESS